MLQRLAPQERAALVLKELFDAPLDEIALVLATTPGAIKSALHRGRERMRESDAAGAAPRPAPPVELVDRFAALYAARVKAGLVALMLDGGQIENVGCGLEFGPDRFPSEDGWFHKAVYGHPEWPRALQHESDRLLRATFEGEPILLAMVVRGGAEALEQVLRIDAEDGRIARLRGYAFCPETMRAVAAALDFPVRTGLYRYPTQAPGVPWKGETAR